VSVTAVKTNTKRVLLGTAGLLLLVGTVLFLTLKSEKEIRKPIESSYSVADPQFQRSLGALLGPALLQGNRVETLLNGDQTFPAMLEAIRSAKKTVTFETYIYWSGDVGKAFADALSERARAGVKVHILIDWVGSQKMDEAYLRQMEDAGAQIRKYHPPHWYNLNRLNNRTHRKILVSDGRVGFTGGIGIADEWSGNAQDENHWRDTHYRVEGPAVAQMQAAFVENWTKVTGDVLHGEAYFPEIPSAGSLPAQMFMSSPESGADNMHLMYLLSIASARKTIDLAMAYFVPDALASHALVEALRRGVKVRIIVPGKKTDVALVRSAGRSTWGPFLEAGAEIYEYEPTMYHCKVLVVDSAWVSVGSTNFDARSFRLNDEANLNVLDPAFAARQAADFENDLKRSRRISYEEWQSRPWREKIQDRFLSFFNSQL
jgi:cardiolipin synthase A/B